ncbi:hypothetical protein CAEBREN_30271 [Caenorhabditis brenneri]|uniref:DUF38 domain-containing protein n=1 Tax=Caenorhabditis brenneri TaxID=135651 RepID=G0N9P1_CAEBE|nr:hypothetical protein CAEBREN_30271 [Caenorhabditis brenneri]
MSDKITRPLSYPSLRIILTMLSLKKREELVRNVPSIRKFEKNITYYFKSVQITDDFAENCFILWIDGLIHRFDYTDDRKETVRVLTDGKSTKEMPLSVISRCLNYYLNRKYVHIRQLTINKASWPLEEYFPGNVRSLKIITAPGIEDSLRKFEKLHFDRVIIVNQCDTSGVYTSKNLLIDSVEMRSDELLEMPIETSAVIRQKCILNRNFTEYCEKLLSIENLSVGISYTAIFQQKNFNIKRLLNDITQPTNWRKTIWNGRKSRTVNMRDNKELLVTWKMKGTVLEPKIHVIASVLEKGTSVDRAPGFIGYLTRMFNRVAHW